MYGSEELFDPTETVPAAPVIGLEGEFSFPTDHDIEIAFLMDAIHNADRRYRRALETIDASEDNRRTTVAALQRELDDARESHRADIEDVISPALHAVAERHEWCGDYEEFVDRANRSLTVEILPRTRDYTVTFSVDVTITVNTNGSDNAAEQGEEIGRTIAREIDSRFSHYSADANLSYDSVDANPAER